MQKILHSIASKVTFGSSLKHSVTVLKSESNDRTDEANGGNSSDLQRHDQKEYELIQHYSVRAVYEDTSKISDEAREQEEFISKLKEFETVEEEAQREVDFQALLGSAPPVSKKKLKLTETIKQFQNLPVQLSLIKEGTIKSCHRWSSIRQQSLLFFRRYKPIQTGGTKSARRSISFWLQ